MDFAKRQLEKYGWKEGSGLGKRSSGIKIALKPALKFDNAGVGFNHFEEYSTNWWETLYNKSANNINVTTNNDSVHVETKQQGMFETAKKGANVPTSTITSIGYTSFIKTSKLTENGIVNLDNKYKKPEKSPFIDIPTLTDDELFAACGGRTAHKGARHGIKLNGKLSRLEMQEKILLKKLNSVSLSDDKDKCNKKNIEKKLKKIEYHKNKNRLDDTMELIPPTSPCILNNNSPHKGNKKRKSERKIVSFSETVVEFHSQDCNETENTNSETTSCEDAASRPSTPVVTIGKLKTEDREESNRNNENNDLDEGIDCTEYDVVKEGSKCDLQEKIRNDNRRMKRKLTKLRILNKPIICNLSGEDKSFTSAIEKNGKWVKRKLFESLEIDNYKKPKWCDSDISYKSKKKLLKKSKRQRRLEKNIDKVTNSFENICKISHSKQE